MFVLRREHAKRKNVMGFPAGVLKVQRCEQDLNAPQFVLLSFSRSRQCNQPHKSNTFVNNFESVSVFVFVVKEAFDLPCFAQDYEDKIEISERV